MFANGYLTVSKQLAVSKHLVSFNTLPKVLPFERNTKLGFSQGKVRVSIKTCRELSGYSQLWKFTKSAMLFTDKRSKRKMLKTNLKVETQNEPCIFNLTESEQRVFFETLFERILKLCNKGE